MNNPVLPALSRKIIQGGMGFYVSTPRLAKAVSTTGMGLGTVSGVALGRVLAYILMNGDPGGHYRRALAHFPSQTIVKTVLDAYFVRGGLPKSAKKRTIPIFTVTPAPILQALCVCGNFAAVYLAKEGHKHPISINYLEKIASAHPYAISGAMLADVDIITVGAGIPNQIPFVIDAVMSGELVKYRIPVEGRLLPHEISFDLKTFLGITPRVSKRPLFIPIVASNVLAKRLTEKLAGKIDGFVFEGPLAGGHNAPPRGRLTLDAAGNALYGTRDEVDFSEVRALGLPFWIAGAQASVLQLLAAQEKGAVGIQIGTAFAFCRESGIRPDLKALVSRLAYEGRVTIKTDPTASPAGFPFKVVQVQGSVSNSEVYARRRRHCEHGALMTCYLKPDGSIGLRCPAEPIGSYLSKGGQLEDTVERRCLCSGLNATIGLGDPSEPPIVTSGDDLVRLMQLLKRNMASTYSVRDVFRYLDLGL